jgi:hypothetical protein
MSDSLSRLHSILGFGAGSGAFVFVVGGVEGVTESDLI